MRVPVIVMTNSDEGALFSPGNIKTDDYQKQVRQIFGDFSDEALKVYPGNTDDEAWHGFGDAFRDMGFAWPSYAWVSLQTKTGKRPMLPSSPSPLHVVSLRISVV